MAASAPGSINQQAAVHVPLASISLSPGDMPHPEPEFPRPLLLGLLAFFTFAQLFYEGMRFGLWVPNHYFTLPLLEFARQPNAFGDDLINLVAPLQMSPFWSLLAWGGDQLGGSFPLFLAVHVLTRWWAALAIFRLSERLFGHPMTGLLAVALWLGYSDAWPGGIALHHDYLAHSDVALTLLLWAVVLWSESRGEWGLWCGLAACVDAPLGVFTFLVLWLVAWWVPPVSRPFSGPGSVRTSRLTALRRRWQHSSAPRLWHSANERLEVSLRPLAWWLVITSLLAVFLAPALRQALSTQSATQTPFTELTTLLRFHTPHAAQLFDEPQGAVWRMLALLAVGLWCWRRIIRGSAARRAVAGALVVLAVCVSAATWLLWRQPESELLLFSPLRIAPLAVSIGLIGVAHVLERAVARQGSGGLLAALLLVFGLVAVPAPSALLLAFGVLFIEVANRTDRRSDTASASQNAFAHSWRLWGLGVLIVVAALCAAWPTMALRLTGSPVAWATVGWMAASLVAWVLTRGLSAPQQRVLRRWNVEVRRFNLGRAALIAFVIAFGWRARASSGWRLHEGNGALSAPQPAAWQAAQLWAKNPKNTPRNALFVASAPGFRTYSHRAMFVDATDLSFGAAVPEFERRWRQRAELVRPLWTSALWAPRISPAPSAQRSAAPSATALRFTPRDLQALRARSVTHLVAETRRRWPRDGQWRDLLRPVYSNREWTIYALR